MRASDSPLGVFDSGLGGLTVVRALRERLPNESIVYLGDTARVPYGTRSAETVVRYARGCAKVLIARKVKALVVACNTVSAVALEVLRAELDLPVVGVVEPGARAAVAAAEAEALRVKRPVKIGVLGTTGTIASHAYPRAVSQVTTRLEVVGQAAPLLVPLAEEGWVSGEVPELAARRYLEPLIAEGAGVVVLGCTHYPLLEEVIRAAAAAVAGRPIPIVDSAHVVAEEVAALCASEKIPARGGADAGSLQILVTDRPTSFAETVTRFLGERAPDVTQIDLV
jgi:glutamate racemase